MPANDYSKMTDGQINVKTHTDVMNRRVYSDVRYYVERRSEIFRDTETLKRIPFYFSDPAASRRVIERLNAMGFGMAVYHMIDGQALCVVEQPNTNEVKTAVNASADRAVCEAAIMAVEGRKP